MNQRGQRTVLVTGATGFVGSALIKRLVHDGYRVRVLIRPKSDYGMLPEGVDIRFGDFADEHIIEEAAAGICRGCRPG